MTTTETWLPINDYPGDQRYDAIPGTPDFSYWGEVGTTEGGWTWTIVRTDDHGSTVDVDGGTVATEAEAKAKVEGWTP